MLKRRDSDLDKRRRECNEEDDRPMARMSSDFLLCPLATTSLAT